MPRWGTRKIKIKKSKAQKKKIFLISLIIFMLMSLQTFIFIEKNLKPILMSIAKARVKQIATNALNDAISKKIAQNNNFRDLIIFETDKDGNIKAAIFNYSEYARIVGEATAKVEFTLNELAKIEEEIPLGAVFNSEMLADLGPRIPVSLVPIGSVQVTPNTMYHNAGINAVIMTVTIDILAEVQVVIPFVTEPTVIKTSVPIAQTQIFGEVPQFYYDGKGTYYGQYPNSENFSIPIVPGIQITPNNNQSQTTPESVPSSSFNINTIPGLEEFYPIIPRTAIPSSGTLQ